MKLMRPDSYLTRKRIIPTSIMIVETGFLSNKNFGNKISAK